ncbi:Glucose-6-phosphate 1-epimerase, partial [Gryllus bimaculatus]
MALTVSVRAPVEPAAFIVCDDAYTRSIWGNNFWLCFWVILQAAELHLRYFVFNTNHLMPFECTPMLMTTFRVPDVMHCQLTGLHECECSEDETDIDFDVEQRQAVRVDDYVRRLYYNTPDLNLSDERTGRTVSLIKDMPDTQIWNPWDGREPMLCFYTQVVEEVDFDPDDYLNMLRISCGHVRKPITLNPNEYFVGHMVIKVDKPRQEHLKKEGKARTSRVLPDLPRDVAFSLPRLPRFSTLLVPGLRDATARSQYASPSLTDIPYMVAEEIFTHVTKKDVPYMMAEDAVARVTDDEVPYKLAEEIVSQVTNK